MTPPTAATATSRVDGNADSPPPSIVEASGFEPNAYGERCEAGALARSTTYEILPAAPDPSRAVP